MKNENFKSKKETQTESFVINADKDTVFPLFGAFEERKWATGWNPVLIYPETEIIEEGTTFTTNGTPAEPDYLWRIVLFDSTSYRIRYLVSTPNRYWTVQVQCTGDQAQTVVTVTYTYIGLNPLGNELNTRDIGSMYKAQLQDWAEAIHDFLFK